MSRTSAAEIKREKRKSFYLQEISTLIQNLAREEPSVASVYITRVDLSADTGICYVYFSAYPGKQGETSEELFKKALEYLKLYKPSLRKALSRRVSGRYTPNLLFLFDDKKDVVNKVNFLLNKVYHDLEEEDKKDKKEK